MKNLAEKGLAREAKTGKKSYWEATDPDTLLAREDEKHRLISLAMPELRAINNSVAGKPRVTYYQGFEGINRAERDLLEVAAKLPLENREILQYGSIEDIIKSPIKGAKETINYRTGHNIRLKFISPWSPAAERLTQGDEQSLRQTILLPKDISIKGVTYIVVGDRIAFYTLDKDQDPSVILIQHPEQAKIQRYLFDWAWDQLKSDRSKR
jgi:sugar-specific transcriptional regulator TrmB